MLFIKYSAYIHIENIKFILIKNNQTNNNNTLISEDLFSFSYYKYFYFIALY